MSGFYAPWFFQQYRNAQGLPLAGGNIQTYISETTAPKALFYDYDLQNPCPNPLPLDSAGFAPAFYLASGLYTFVIRDSSGNIISSRDNVSGVISSLDINSISATSASYRVKIDDNDTNPGYLWNKLSATNTIDFTNTGDKIAINVKDAWKVRSNPNDPTPNYLNEKIMDTDTVILSISANKLRADFSGPTLSTPGYLYSQFENTDTITWATSASKILANVSSGKVQITSSDTLEYLEDKLQAGSGIVFTKTSDINGEQIHISTTNSTTNAGKVKVTSGDTLEYLSDKLLAGSGITISADNNNITISNTNTISNGYLSVVRTALEPWTYGTDIGFQNAISATLSAGTWEIGGTANVAMTLSGVLPTRAIAAISTTAFSQPDDGYETYAEKNQDDSPMSLICFPKRFTFESSTVVYLVVYSYGSYSAGRIWGNITARQVS